MMARKFVTTWKQYYALPFAPLWGSLLPSRPIRHTPEGKVIRDVVRSALGHKVWVHGPGRQGDARDSAVVCDVIVDAPKYPATRVAVSMREFEMNPGKERLLWQCRAENAVEELQALMEHGCASV